MAYKFQLGKAKLSGSIETAQGITSQGGLLVNGDVDLDAGVINNAELQNSSVRFNGVSVSLGGTGSFGTDAVTEGSSNLYYTDARARSAVSHVDAGGDGSFSYNSTTGVFTYTGPSAAEARAHFSVSDTNSIDMGYDSSTGAFTGNLRLSGSGLEITADGLRIASAAADQGLGWTDGKLVAKVTGSMQIANDKISINSSIAGSGLGHVSDADGAVSTLSVNVDGSSIEIDTDALRVKALGVTNAMLAGSIENGKLVNSSVTVTAGNGLTDGGLVSLGGSVSLNVAAASANAIVVTADGIDLKSTISGDRSFTGNVTINNLNVTGTLTTINTTNLEVVDARILIASGSSAFTASQGIDFGGYAQLITAVDADVGNALSSSLPMVMPSIKAGAFYGSFVGSTVLSIESKGVDALISRNVTKATANITLTLPSAPVTGQEHRVKCVVAEASSPSVIVAAQAGATIEGEASVLLQSYGAAVSLVWDGSAWMVF